MPSILVADDNTNIQKMVSLAFEDRGITVHAVGNGEAAVRRIPDLNPDLVLADIFMPVRNGYEVCEFVKKDQRFAHVPVILLVGAFDPLDEKEARRVGADGVLKKPFVPPDPLIAMVISALEKNPRVVAELAKAKAAAEVHAAPEAAADSFEIASLPKPEPKPLPDFPEPSPEEAAVIYGFGKGVRAFDDEEIRAGKEPPAPVAHRDEEDDDEGAATASDWRRNAMDFEVPETQANQPAYSMLDELEPATFFPSEADARHPLPKTDKPAVAAHETVREAAPVFEPPQPNPHMTPVVAQELDMRAVEPVELTPLEHEPVRWPEQPVAKEPISMAPVPVEPRAAAPLPVPEPAHKPQPEPAHAHEHEAKPSLMSRARHWMDSLVAPSAHEEVRHDSRDVGDWMDALSQPVAPKVEAVDMQPQPASLEPPPAAAPEAAKPAVEESFFAEEPASSESTASEYAPRKSAPVEMARREIPALEAPVAPTPAVAEPSRVMEIPPAIETKAEPVEMPAPVAHASESFNMAAPEPSADIWERDDESTPSMRDPELVVPEAVHVRPEPLLVEEAPEKPSKSYFARSEEVPAAYTFEVPASPEPVAETEDASVEEALIAPEPSFAIVAAESTIELQAEPEVELDEALIPTGPPPNREALAEIPFLNPPRDFDPNARPAPAPAAVDSSTVDAVVQKVLEKLQPQLHDLLSQGVLKPLVENLLQQEAAKKEK